jgi:predicted AAA+ superfamily ATPase
MFGAVLVTGARQVGKTTLLQEVAKDAGCVTLDDRLQWASAVNRSVTFFKDNPPPVFVDEVQRAPELFLGSKTILYREKKRGGSSCQAPSSSR